MNEWELLHKHYRDDLAKCSIASLFYEDTRRFEKFSVTCDDLLLDFSKTKILPQTLALLTQLAHASGVEKQRDAMMRGEKINISEERAVLHTALRNNENGTVKSELQRMFSFVNEAQHRFDNIINIGIGGSELGPKMATAALSDWHTGPRPYFVSNIDNSQISKILSGLQPRKTLFIVSSKSFATEETMTNAITARQWLISTVGEKNYPLHFAAATAAGGKAIDWGIPKERVFNFWDWVGGRYSVWSAAGLSLLIAIGENNFRAFLEGAHTMDKHFCDTPIEQNLPMLLGLIGIWHRNICGHETRAILPYDYHLRHLPAYLQQVDMESNGKSVTADGTQQVEKSAPVTWGGVGSNSQHAFYQLLHQGTITVPCEFLASATGGENHTSLLAHCLAQSKTLMQGRSAPSNSTNKDEAKAHISPHRIYPGDKPSLTVLYKQLNPETLGKLLSLYEHRAFVEGVIWGVNSFDQWGVELGKELAEQLKPMLLLSSPTDDVDSSTRGLLAHIRNLKT